MSNSKVDYSYCTSNIALAIPSMFVQIAGVSKYYVTLLNRANSVQRWTVFKKCCSSVVQCSGVHSAV